jgi:hypothetical protein
MEQKWPKILEAQLLFCIVLTAAYSSCITSTVLAPPASQEIETFKQLFDSGYKWHFFQEYERAALFSLGQISNYSRFRFDIEKHTIVGRSELLRTNQYLRHVNSGDKRLTEWMFGGEYCKMAKEAITFVNIWSVRGYFVNRYLQIYQQFVEHGFLDIFKRQMFFYEMWYDVWKCRKESKEIVLVKNYMQLPQKLTMHSAVQILIFYYLITNALSLAVFLVEKIFFLKKNKI